MEFVVGFVIAVLIGLTGVGGGVITAPVLTPFLGVPPAEAVGTALVFTGVVKFVAAPLHLLRKQVDFRILSLLLAGGLPGVIIGSYALQRLNAARYHGAISSVLGASILAMSALNLYWLFAKPRGTTGADHSRWLPLIAAPLGAEVGFSSAGAGALGSVVLMTMTRISPGQVVGTDVLFGLGLSLAGGGMSFTAGTYHAALALRMSAGGIVGALVGANLLAILPPRPVRVALLLWLASLGGELCWPAIGG